MIPAALLALVVAAGSQTAPLQHIPTERQYAATVHAIRLVLDRAAARSGNASLAQQAQRSLQSLAVVRLPDGRTIAAALPSLAETLDPTDSGSVADTASTLDRLDDALQSESSRVADPRQLATLDHVLRDPRFHPYQNPIERLRQWIGEQINGVVNWIIRKLIRVGVGAADAPLLAHILLALLLLGTIAGLIYLIARGALKRIVTEVGPDAKGDDPTTARAASALLHDYVSAGDWRTALRYLLLGTLLELQEQGILELRPGLTNREYLRGLQSDIRSGPLREPLSAVIDAFDRSWYGHLPLTGDDYRRCVREAERALSVARQGAA